MANSTHRLVIVAEMKRTLLDENLPPANRLRIVEALEIAQRFGGLAPEVIALVDLASDAKMDILDAPGPLGCGAMLELPETPPCLIGSSS